MLPWSPAAIVYQQVSSEEVVLYGRWMRAVCRTESSTICVHFTLGFYKVQDNSFIIIRGHLHVLCASRTIVCLIAERAWL